MPKTYNADYFIKKFKAIPAKLWCEGDYTDGDRHCALGHCGTQSGELKDKHTPEGRELWRIIGRVTENQTWNPAALVNDGCCDDYKQKSPKARILAALKDAKEQGL
jgi:hypothetical protein